MFSLIRQLNLPELKISRSMLVTIEYVQLILSTMWI